MQRISSYFTIVILISIFILFQYCKTDESNIVTPTKERPVYENSGTVGSDGGIVQVTTQNSPINGAFVDIPKGALSNNATISISQAP